MRTLFLGTGFLLILEAVPHAHSLTSHIVIIVTGYIIGAAIAKVKAGGV